MRGGNQQQWDSFNWKEATGVPWWYLAGRHILLRCDLCSLTCPRGIGGPVVVGAPGKSNPILHCDFSKDREPCETLGLSGWEEVLCF